MAFTIRELSTQASDNLQRLQDNNRAFFKGKAKAIDFVLSNFYSTEAHVKELEAKNKLLRDKVDELKQTLDDVKFAVNILKQL